MRAIYLESKGVLKEKDIPMPKVKESEVLVKVMSVGVCGSDVHYWENGRIGKFVVEQPLILGHEVSAEVVDPGNETGLQKGDLVVLEPGTPCRHCQFCQIGRYNLCPNIVFFATPPNDGALCEYLAHDSSLVYRVPEGIAPDVATLVEPLAVGIFTAKKARIGLGDRVLIYGSGVIGLCAIVAARTAGAAYIEVADVRDDRLEMARKMGADAVVNVSKEQAAASDFDVAIECSGAPISIQDASRTVRPGGKIVLLGLGSADLQEVPIVHHIINEQDLIPVFRYANAYPDAIYVLSRNIHLFKNLITHKFTFDEAQLAFKAAKEDPSTIKAVINMF